MKKLMLMVVLIIKTPAAIAVNITIASTAFSTTADLPETDFPEVEKRYVSQFVWENLPSFFSKRNTAGKNVGDYQE